MALNVTATPIEIEPTLRRAAEGDGSAWRELVEAFTPRVYGLLARQCGDRELAEELTQITFVKVVAKLTDGYEELGKFEPWLFRIAMNGLRDEMRRRKRQASSMDMSPGASSGRGDEASGWAAAQQTVRMGGPAAAEDPSECVSRDEQVELLRLAVSEMSEADREVIHLRHTVGMSFAEIAETLDQPLGTVLARGHRAIKKLKGKLEAYEQRKTA